MVEIVFIILTAVLWRLGGTNKKAWMRDVLVPILVGVYLFYVEQNWLLSFFMMGSMQIIRMGYGAYDPINDDKPSFLGYLLKDTEGSLTRGIVGAIYILIGTIPLMSYKLIHSGLLWLIWPVFMAIQMFGISFCLSKVKVKDYVIEPAIGASLAVSIIMMTKGVI